jgi:hypothetical protein
VSQRESDPSDGQPPTGDFALSASRHGSTHIVHVTGPLDPGHAARVRTTVEELLAANPAAVYRSLEEALDPNQQEIGELREELHQRERQLATQPAIEQAKGMLMQDFGISADEAFAVLRRLSQDSNTKLRSVAERLVTELKGTVSDKTAQAAADAIAELRHRLDEDDP